MIRNVRIVEVWRRGNGVVRNAASVLTRIVREFDGGRRSGYLSSVIGNLLRKKRTAVCSVEAADLASI